jgi:hypothetical protein
VEQFVGLMLDKSGRGNHATQTTSAKRPKLAARYNLLTYTEQFDNAAWTKLGATVTQNAAVAPNNTLTADKLIADSAITVSPSSVAAFVRQDITKAATATTYTFSLFAKAGEFNAVRLFARDSVTSANNAAVTVLLTSGTVLTAAAAAGTFTNASVAITNSGNGWYRVALTFTSSTETTIRFIYAVGDSSSTTGNASKGIYIWGADLRPASQATGLIGPTYQRVVDAATYDTVGFLPYLEFDGLDDEMAITTLSTLITASEYEACVGARVIKSNTNSGTVYNNNQIMGDSAQYFSTGYVRNTANVIGAYNWDGTQDETNQALTAPATTVLQQWHQGGNLSLALNGGSVTSVASGNTTSLSGNVRLGRGADSPPFLVWNCYGVLLRNAALTSAQRASMLAWMNGKTGAF